MVRLKKIYGVILLIFVMALCASGVYGQQGQEATRTLRLAYHIFNDEGGLGNFQADSVSHRLFLDRMTQWINHKMLNLDTLKPVVSSGYVKSMNLQIFIDTTFYHNDTYAWDCSDSLDSEYMRRAYVDLDTIMTYRQKHQTLHIFMGDNYPILGGHVSQLGTKRLIAMRGVFSNFQLLGSDRAVFQCGRNLFHEIGHALGLEHNFQGGPSGDQCDNCNDNGCPIEGTSNNLMDYWPTYGMAISECQLEIIDAHLSGELGDIADVLINDSCYLNPDSELELLTDYLLVTDMRYLHESLSIENGGVLEIKGCLSVPHDQFIRIRPGGKLLVDGGQITNLCGDLWKGIELIAEEKADTPAEIRIENGAQIAHARVGVRISGFSRVILAHAEFNNCIRSIVIDNFSQELLTMSDIGFISNNNYHRSEEGAGIQDFIEIADSRLMVHGCLFSNTDQFRSLSPIHSGTGINSNNSNLSCFGNVFQFLSTGIIAGDKQDSCKISVSNCQFEFCLVGIHNFQASYINIEQTSFSINRFSGLYSIGVLAEEPGWLSLKDCTFSSDYGGGDLIGYYQIENRGGTQYLSDNSFDLLGWGIVQLAGKNEPEWPDILWNKPNDHLNISGMGLVLNHNQFWLVNKNFTLMGSEGKGLVDKGVEHIQSLSRSSEAFNWSIGGLTVFDQANSLALIQSNSIMSMPTGLDHNFFFNRASNTLGSQIHKVDPVDLQKMWIGEDFPILLPNSGMQEWVLAEEILLKNPFFLRSSVFRDKYLINLNSWPRWALDRMIDISHRSDTLDEPMVHMIRNFADQQFSVISENSESSYPALRKRIRDSITDYNLIKLPDDLFIPRLPPLELGADAGFSIYPNPVDGNLYLHPDKELGLSKVLDITYMIFSVNGQLIKMGTVQSMKDFVISVSHLSAGIYTICLRDVKRFYGTRKFIILRS